jgi:linoleoyl-CoA desaturase
VGSFFISLVFQISHISKKNKFDLIEDFATNQIETTHDYSVRSKWVTLLTGGLNFQVIHHLLPNVSQIYYLDLYDMVNDICKKHGKLYTKSSTIFGALQSHFKQIKQMSEDKYFEDDEYYIINKKMN